MDIKQSISPLGSLAVIAALIFLVGGLVAVYSQWQFISHTQKATGKVINSAIVNQRVGGQTSYGNFRNFVNVQFQDSQGKLVNFTDATSLLSPNFSVGDKVGVIYNPANPEQAKIDNCSYTSPSFSTHHI